MEEAVRQNVHHLPLRLMFQDEARFGRLSDPRKCWAPMPLRPLVSLALVREYIYAYATVTPQDGALDWMMARKMNTPTMGTFLQLVSERHPAEFIVMVVDGASSHRAHDLMIPVNMALLKLPPYSPELNPVEHLWEELREKEFGNRIFDTLKDAVFQVMRGLKRIENSPEFLKSLTGWEWILKVS